MSKKCKEKDYGVLFIHSPNLHESHKMFAEAINADFEPVYTKKFKGFRRFSEAFKRSRELQDYPIYLLEGGMPMFPAYLKKRKRKGIRMTGLLADETFINLVEKQPHYSFAETLIHRISAKCLDGAIAVSPFIKSYAKKILRVPIKVARPPISSDNYKKLSKINPNLDSSIIVSVGGARFSIGMDILIDQFRYAKQKIPKLKLWIVGKNHPKEYEKVKGVSVLGYKEDLREIFSEANLFVHSGRCSAYPVATLEAMRAGIPVIVSDMTGTKEIVERVEDEVKREFNLKYKGYYFVKPLNQIANGIIAYYSKSKEEKKKLSEKFRKESEYFDPDKRCEHFRQTFNKLLGEG